MACGGCRRSRKNTGSRTKKKKTIKAAPVATHTLDAVELAIRKKKCSKCPFNTSTGLSGRCKKVNRMISKAINDPSFKCPIKRF